MSKNIQYRIREFNKRFYPQYSFGDGGWSDFSSKDVFQRPMPGYPVWFHALTEAREFLDKRMAVDNLNKEIIYNYP